MLTTDLKQEPTLQKANDRMNNFNIIRFVASVMVIYGHMMHIMGVPIFTVYNQAISTIAEEITKFNLALCQ